MSDPTITKYLLGSAVMASQVLTSVLHIQKYKKYKCSFSYMCGCSFDVAFPTKCVGNIGEHARKIRGGSAGGSM